MNNDFSGGQKSVFAPYARCKSLRKSVLRHGMSRFFEILLGYIKVYIICVNAANW